MASVAVRGGNLCVFIHEKQYTCLFFCFSLLDRDCWEICFICHILKICVICFPLPFLSYLVSFFMMMCICFSQNETGFRSSNSKIFSGLILKYLVFLTSTCMKVVWEDDLDFLLVLSEILCTFATVSRGFWDVLNVLLPEKLPP